MSKSHFQYNATYIKRINNTIKKYFPDLKTIEDDYHISMNSISRKIMLDRYSQKDKNLVSLEVGDIVLTTIHFDARFPSTGIGTVKSINKIRKTMSIEIESDSIHFIDQNLLLNDSTNVIEQSFYLVDKPLELFYEQIAFRVAGALASQEKNFNNIFKWHKRFYRQICDQKIVPAGRVLYGAGSDSKVTLFNCFVLPFIKDSRDGIACHRQQVAEIMSHGGGVGSNGSTLRPRGSIAKTVGGRSSGAVSWLDDISSLTHLVIQGGSRRGAQMIMLDIRHPDIIEFILSKMQNLKVLLWLRDHFKNPLILQEINNKLDFKKLTDQEIKMYEEIIANAQHLAVQVVDEARYKLNNQGTWQVKNRDALVGANISVTLSNDFMEAVKNNEHWSLVFPDLESYSAEEKTVYDETWHAIGDARKWAKLGHKNKVYATLKARELWHLINICANYSAEPGIFYIDRANEMTNAVSYDQKVVATNPCAEQPLPGYSVCNLSAVNLSQFVDKKTGTVLYDQLKETVADCVRMQDNVIDATYYFCQKNEKQAKGERRIGLGVMGLHDLLIFAGKSYGSPAGNQLIDQVFKTICETAYETSSLLAREKGSFPFLKGRHARFVCKSGFIQTMSKRIQTLIIKNGIRNSHLLTVAPTGSTGSMVKRSTGIEPYYTFEPYYRSGRLGKAVKVWPDIVEEYKAYHPTVTPEEQKKLFVGAMDLTPEEHVNILCLVQRWIDSAISKTINAPRGFTVKDVQKIYMMLYDKKAKGGTVYVDGSRDAQVLSLTTDDNNLDIVELTDLGFQLYDDDAPNLEQKKNAKMHFNQKIISSADQKSQQEATGAKIGLDLNDLCSECRVGTIVLQGGCTTCTYCQIQFKCEA